MSTRNLAGTRVASRSELLSLSVSLPADDDPRLPRPYVPEANTNDELRLDDFEGSPGVVLVAWPLMAAGQLLWIDLSWNGGELRVVQAHPVTTSEVGATLSYRVPRSELLRLSDGTALTLRATVAFNGSADERRRVAFPTTKLTLRAAGPAFWIDPSEVRMKVGDSRTRRATGGTQPYVYASTNAGVAVVDTIGQVTAVAAGSAGITASDARQGKGSYPVIVEREAIDFGGPNTLNCTGYVVAEGRPPRNPPAMARYTRVPVGGTPPYTYSSSNPTVASVDSSGTVTASANGTSTITARDSRGITAAHSLTVYGAKVWRHRRTWGFITYAAQTGIFAQEGDLVRCPADRAEIAALRQVYLPEGNPAQLLGWLDNYYWTSEFHPNNNHYWVRGLGSDAQDGARYDSVQALMALVKG
ncbi:Ig-like domain-containing protein [Xanthomonas sp. NCPPB 2632]|uniref:Ig-like domain-containing protein n=1 Tax=Xanthomonas sp. NCPPB 2632 TaxID=3240912 RepID=UPI0035186B6D